MQNKQSRFILQLSREKIQLLINNGDGGYDEIGSADPNESHVTNNLKVLRNQVYALTGQDPLIDVILPDELILIQNLTIESDKDPLSKEKAVELVSNACELKPDEIKVVVGTPTSNRTQPIAAVTTKTLDETRYFLNNAGFKTHRFIALKHINGFSQAPVFIEDPLPKKYLGNNKSTAIASLSIFILLFLISTLMVILKPLGPIELTERINTSKSSRLFSADTSDFNIDQEKFYFSTPYQPPIFNKSISLRSPEYSNNILKSRMMPIQSSIEKFVFDKAFHILTFSSNDLVPSRSTSTNFKNKSNTKNETQNHWNTDFFQLSSNMKQFSKLKQFTKLHSVKAAIQADYLKSKNLGLNSNKDTTKIQEIDLLTSPTRQVKNDHKSRGHLPRPKPVLPANFDSRYFDQTAFQSESPYFEIIPNFGNGPSFNNKEVSKNISKINLLNRKSLSNVLYLKDYSPFTPKSLTPQEILRSNKYQPITRPSLIAKINVLVEPTISSGAVTLSQNPLNRPGLVISLSPLSTRDVTIVAKATKRPSFPRRASILSNATITNIIELNRTNLIGIFGTKQLAIALIRLASGKVIKVKVGDRFDGWKVLTIYEDKVELANGNKQETLRLPG